uniref:Uncharacterized protein n=1 Tax=Avena sativa TaxID=4498 RepID=A0ACD5Y8T0_AVESA
MASWDDAQIKSWTGRDFFLAALGGCLAAISIVIILFVVLSPGRIIFSVNHASLKKTVDGQVNLTLTVFANNTSHRAKVRFLSFFVAVTDGLSFRDAVMDRTFPFPTTGYLSQPGFMNITASVNLERSGSFGRQQQQESSTRRLTVVLTSQVRFLVGVAPTKIFDIRVSCPHVTFVQEPPKSPAYKGRRGHVLAPSLPPQATFPCDG